VSVVVGYPQLNLSEGINSENISSDKWPDDGATDPEPLQT